MPSTSQSLSSCTWAISFRCWFNFRLIRSISPGIAKSDAGQDWIVISASAELTQNGQGHQPHKNTVPELGTWSYIMGTESSAKRRPDADEEKFFAVVASSEFYVPKGRSLFASRELFEAGVSSRAATPTSRMDALLMADSSQIVSRDQNPPPRIECTCWPPNKVLKRVWSQYWYWADGICWDLLSNQPVPRQVFRPGFQRIHWYS